MGKALYQVLFYCDMLTLVQRLLKVRLPKETMARPEVPWSAVHYNSMVIIKYLVDFSDSTISYYKDLVQSDTVELLLEYCGEDLDIVSSYPAMYSLKGLCSNNMEACERLIFSNGLPKLGHMILKDNCQKAGVKTFSQGLSPYQEKILESFYWQNLLLMNTMPFKHDAEIAFKVVIFWSFTMQMCSAMILIKVCVYVVCCTVCIFNVVFLGLSNTHDLYQLVKLTRPTIRILRIV